MHRNSDMSARTRVVEVTERGQRFFPRSDLVDSLGQSLVLPETRDLKAFEIKDSADGAQLVTFGLIGYLPLTKNVTLNIVPKFPIGNLWTMLEVGSETYRNVLRTLRRYHVSSHQAPIHLLARSFCQFLRGMMEVGLQRDYYLRHRTGYYRPRVQFGPTIGRFVSRGDPVRAVSNIFEFGLDSPVNQIVKAACLRFVRIVPDTADWDQERALLNAALDAHQHVQEREPNPTEFKLAKSVSFRIEQHYAGMLRVYQLLLTGGGIGFTYDSGGKELPSFLFNLEGVFERFIRETFARGFRNAGVAVLDGNRHPGWLFEDNSCYPTKADLIFRSGSKEVIALGEVKYKPRLRESDRYQIISHTTAAKAPIGILFRPANEDESQSLDRMGRLSTGAQFYQYVIDIAGDLATSQERMVQDIHSLLKRLPITPLSLQGSYTA